MKAPRRRSWAEMDHDDELLFEQIVRPKRVDHRGPIAEFLAEKDAEQAKQTCDGYRYSLQRFLAFVGEEATVGDVTETTGHRFLRYLREEGLSENTIAIYSPVSEGVHPLDAQEGLDRAPGDLREALSAYSG